MSDQPVINSPINATPPSAREFPRIQGESSIARMPYEARTMTGSARKKSKSTITSSSRYIVAR